MVIEQRLRNLVVSGFGTSLKKNGNLIKVVSKEGDKESTVLVTPKGLEQVIVSGECGITSGLVRLLMENDVDLVFVGHNPKFFARVMRHDQMQFTDVWRAQILLSDGRKMEIGREMIDAAIYNRMRMMQTTARNRGADLSDTISRIEECREKLPAAANRETLMGVEGESARVYFEALKNLIPQEFGFRKREKNPPLDPVNSMLSYGYTVLASRVEYGLMCAGLNPYEGIIHPPQRMRRSLTFDLIEEFRQPVVDRIVLTLATQKRLRPDDFEKTQKMCKFKDEAKKLYLEALYSRMEATHSYRGGTEQYLDIIFLQARELANSISKGTRYRAFKWR